MRRLALAFMILPVLVPAQNTSCALSGTVQDSAGAVIPGITITLTGEGNRLVRTTTTTHEGFFSFPDLTPATFTIAIEAPGCKKYRQTGILINADEHRSLGQVKLQVGQVSESVTVSADVVSVNTTNGERAGTLSGEQLDEIALRGRDLFDAISLLPGVVDTSDGRGAPSPQSLGNIYVLGGRNDAKNMTIDGVTDIDTGANNTGITTPTGTPSDSARLEVMNPTAPLKQRFGPPPEPAGQASVANAGSWLSTSTAPEFGNLGQNTLTGPGTDNWDLSLYRVLPFKEDRLKVMLRLETYNTFNHTQFNGINSTAQFNTLGQQVNTAFLLPTGARPPRYVQIAMRVSF